jgi:predicted neutral ceramidase superfamily lipid hydrolase
LLFEFGVLRGGASTSTFGNEMKASHKIWLALIVAGLSPLISAWIAFGRLHLNDALFCLPAIVLIFPLFAFALLLRSWGHRKSALGAFVTGMLTYLAYAVSTLGGELMLPMIGNVYIPAILTTLAFGIYALLDRSGGMGNISPNKSRRGNPYQPF